MSFWSGRQQRHPKQCRLSPFLLVAHHNSMISYLLKKLWYPSGCRTLRNISQTNQKPPPFLRAGRYYAGSQRQKIPMLLWRTGHYMLQHWPTRQVVSTAVILTWQLWGFWLDMRLAPREIFHVLYYKSGQKSMTEELTGPKENLLVCLKMVMVSNSLVLSSQSLLGCRGRGAFIGCWWKG